MQNRIIEKRALKELSYFLYKEKAMINIRLGLFETNSSSMHTLTLIMDKSMFAEWKQNPEERFLKINNNGVDTLVPEDFSLVSRDYILENSTTKAFEGEDDEFYYLVYDVDCLIFDEDFVRIVNNLDNYVIIKYESY